MRRTERIILCIQCRLEPSLLGALCAAPWVGLQAQELPALPPPLKLAEEVFSQRPTRVFRTNADETLDPARAASASNRGALKLQSARELGGSSSESPQRLRPATALGDAGNRENKPAPPIKYDDDAQPPHLIWSKTILAQAPNVADAENNRAPARLRSTNTLSLAEPSPESTARDLSEPALKTATTLSARKKTMATRKGGGEPFDPPPPRLAWADAILPRSRPGIVARSNTAATTQPTEKHLGQSVFRGAGERTLLAGADKNTSEPTTRSFDEPEPPVPFEAVRPGPTIPPPKAEQLDIGSLPDLTLIDWTIPPIRWGGNTSSIYSLNQGSGTSNFSATQTLNLRASSYIYQPWYAQVSGDIGLATGSSKQTGGTSSSTTETSVANTNPKNTSVNYGGNLNLFPQSRFPFNAYVGSADSRASANATTTQYTATRFGARQSYRPETGQESYSANFDHSTVTSSDVRSIVNAWQGNYSDSFDDHSLSAAARFSTSSGDVGGQGSSLLTLSGSHSWRLDEDLNISSYANFANNEIKSLSGLFGTGLQLQTNNSQLLALGSSFSWVPDEDLPLTVSGGANFMNSNVVTDQGNLTAMSINGYANANYRFSNNLSGSAGVTMFQSQSDNLSFFSTGQNATISYSGDPLNFGDYFYTWGGGGGINNQIVSTGGGSHGGSTSVQHALMRNIPLTETSMLSMNAGQSFSLNFNSTSGTFETLTHSGGGSWRADLGERSTAMLTMMLSDSMSSGQYGSHYRSLLTQGNFQTQLSRRSALTANINFNVSQQVKTPSLIATTVTPANPLTPLAPPSPAPQPLNTNGNTSISGSGSVSYAHQSPFDISNLTYSANVQLNANQVNLRVITGDPNALSWQTGTIFQQNADYRLGRLNFRVTQSLAAMNGKKNASLFGMVTRQFGDF